MSDLTAQERAARIAEIEVIVADTSMKTHVFVSHALVDVPWLIAELRASLAREAELMRKLAGAALMAHSSTGEQP